VVADTGHDVAKMTQVVAGQGVEQQAADDLDMAGQDAADEGQDAHHDSALQTFSWHLPGGSGHRCPLLIAVQHGSRIASRNPIISRAGT